MNRVFLYFLNYSAEVRMNLSVVKAGRLFLKHDAFVYYIIHLFTILAKSGQNIVLTVSVCIIT